MAGLSLFHNATVALVGNAGYLADAPQGGFIDGHDVIIRMNNFRTTGYEQQVGQRTDVYLTNFWEDIDFANPDAAAARVVASSSPNNFRTHRRLGVALRHGPLITEGMRRMQRSEVYVPSLDWFTHCIQRIGRYPTTGAVGALMATELLLPVAKSLYMTGFSFFEGRNHYFSERPRDVANHHVEGERRLLQQRIAPLASAGRVTLDARLRRLLG